MDGELKDVIKPLFYMITGKPDSLMRIYTRDVIITPKCIEQLNNQIHDKLYQYEINGLVFTATLSFENNTSIEFGNWEEFNSYDWDTHEISKSIVIKWDFLVKIPNYASPQRHSITLRIAQGTTQKELLLLMLNNNLEDLEKVDLNNSPMFCRVDFINTLLGTEILELVERWNKSRKIPEKHNSFFKKIWNRRHPLANFIEHSLIILILLLIFSSVEFMTRQFPFNEFSSEFIKIYSYWLISIALLFILSQKFSLFMAKKFFNAISGIGQYAIFQLTQGDENKQIDLNQINKTKGIHVWITMSLSIMLNITTGVISAYLYDLFG